MPDHASLRLSAQRALLGRIHGPMRLIKIKAVEQAAGCEVVLTVVMTCEPDDRIRDDISVTAAEIVADFPEVTRITERFEVTMGPLPRENSWEEGWVFERAE